MKNVLKFIFILLSIILVNCNGQKQRVQLSDIVIKNVEGQDVGFYNNKKFTGIVFSIYDNQYLEFEISFKNGLKDGKFERYHHNNGKLFFKTTYKKGELDGLCEEYYENGQLKEKSFYVNGKIHGDWESFSSNGKLLKKVTFKNGIEVKE